MGTDCPSTCPARRAIPVELRRTIGGLLKQSCGLCAPGRRGAICLSRSASGVRFGRAFADGRSRAYSSGFSRRSPGIPTSTTSSSTPTRRFGPWPQDARGTDLLGLSRPIRGRVRRGQRRRLSAEPGSGKGASAAGRGRAGPSHSAAAQGADPSTLIRAARDFCGKEPKFASTVALLALSSLLAGGGYDPSVLEVDDAVKHLLSASRQIGSVEWALRELRKLAERQCAAGREPFQHAVQAALSRWRPGEPNL